MAPSKLMIIRHAEKPNKNQAEANVKKHLTALGWQRAGALVTLFLPPWGPTKGLETPQFLYASNPNNGATPEEEEEGMGPSERPYETLLPIAS